MSFNLRGSPGTGVFLGQYPPGSTGTGEPPSTGPAVYFLPDGSQATFDDTVGNDGDVYTDTLTGNSYLKAGGSWV